MSMSKKNLVLAVTCSSRTHIDPGGYFFLFSVAPNHPLRSILENFLQVEVRLTNLYFADPCLPPFWAWKDICQLPVSWRAVCHLRFLSDHQQRSMRYSSVSSVLDVEFIRTEGLTKSTWSGQKFSCNLSVCLGSSFLFTMCISHFSLQRINSFLIREDGFKVGSQRFCCVYITHRTSGPRDRACHSWIFSRQT